MIEMLGVLAIIGILSAGGIMGYSKAMENYKVNQTIKDIEFMAAAATRIFDRHSGQRRVYFADDIAKLEILPEKYVKSIHNCITQLSNYKCVTPLIGDEFLVGVTEGAIAQTYKLEDSTQKQYTEKNYRTLGIMIYNLPKAAYVKLLTHDWSNLLASGILLKTPKGNYLKYSPNDEFYPSSSYGYRFGMEIWINTKITYE